MAIHKNADFFGQPVTLLEFGKGDVHLMAVQNSEKKYTAVLFGNKQLGANGEVDNTLNINELEVVLLFTKVESIDVLIDALQTARDSLNNMRNEIPTTDENDQGAGNAPLQDGSAEPGGTDQPQHSEKPAGQDHL